MFLALLLLLGLDDDTPAVDVTYTPDEIHRLAFLDLIQQPYPERTRYLALHALPPNERSKLTTALLYWLNVASNAKRFGKVVAVRDDSLLLRLDLEEFALDRYSRAEYLAAAKELGVTIHFSGVSQHELEDIWELFAREDPYFKVNTHYADGTPFRGWIDPRRHALAARLSRSRMFILRGDWFLAKAALAKPKKDFAGLYNELLMLPASEPDLRKLIGVDEKAILQFRRNVGGAVASGKSGVAVHNRELELFPALAGPDKFYWRTRDTVDDRNDRSINRQLAGTLRFDGQEAIWGNDVGLHRYWLNDGNRQRADEVPIDIAQIRGQAGDPRVMTGYTCLKCHGNSGMIGFDDDVAPLLTGQEVGVAVLKLKDRRQQVNEKRRVEDFYLNETREPQTTAQQESYQARVRKLTGLNASANARNLIGQVESYIDRPVNLDQVARELGVPRSTIVDHLKANANPQQVKDGFLADPDLLALCVDGGHGTVSRPAWEAAFAAAATIPKFPWESAHPYPPASSPIPKGGY